MASFFAKGNLTTLRKLAMLSAAERVDAQLQEHMAANAIEGPWPTQERIPVLLPEAAIGRDAIRIGKRSVDRARVEWYVLALPDCALKKVKARAAAMTVAQPSG